jgi:hypothetical protein
LGDDEMEAFDSKLAEIFSQRKSIKNVKKGTFLLPAFCFLTFFTAHTVCREQRNCVAF